MLVDSSGSMKPADKPDRDHVAHPRLAPAAGLEADRARFGHRFAVEVGQQSRRRLVLADAALS